MVLSQAGDVYTWGMNYLGQLGLLDTVQRLVPVKVKKSQPGQLFIAFIAAGAFKFMILCSDLCINFFYVRIFLPFVTICIAGAYHTLMIDDSGIIYSFGSNRDGQLGLGFNDFNPHPEPTAVSFVYNKSGEVMPIPNLRGTVIYSGGYHNIAISAQQDIYIWGWNKFGQLGLGHTQSMPYATICHSSLSTMPDFVPAAT